MCRAVEELLREDKLDAARKLLADGTLTVEKIAECLGLVVEDVEKLVVQK